MFERLFKYQRVVARHREGPLANERGLYLSHCADYGAALATLQRLACELLVVAKEIKFLPNHQVSIEEIEAASHRWARRQQRRRRAHTQQWSRNLFASTATQWLRFIGHLREADPISAPYINLIDSFAAFVSDRCLSQATIHNYCWHVNQFLGWFHQQGRSFAGVTVTDVDAFLALMGKQGWKRISIASCARALRAFFIYAESRAWCSKRIAIAIESPRIFKEEGVPSGPAWTDVQRLIASTNTDQPRDIRDRGILMLFACHALRVGEVARLCLKDIDWERDALTVQRSKQQRIQKYPLTPAVAWAIIRYLKEVRPRCTRREVFLTLKAPFRRLSPGGLYNITRSRFSQLGISAPHRGPHSLRHACATHLVSEGLSLKEIGDHLGHTSSHATRVYAKVDLTGLREVASFDLGGLS